MVCASKEVGTIPESRDDRHNVYSGSDNVSLQCFKTIAGKPSGPFAEYIPISSIAVLISLGLNSMSDELTSGIDFVDSWLLMLEFGVLKTDLYCVCKMSAISFGSLVSSPVVFSRGPIVEVVLRNFFA